MLNCKICQTYAKPARSLCLQIRRCQAGLLPLTLSQRPRGDDPQGDHEDQQHRAGADGHQGLEDEPGVEVDAIQGSYTARRRVREELRMQQHHPADEVEPKEHRQREGHVVRHPLGADVAVFVRQLGRPQEVVLARNRVDRADHQLQRDLRDPLPGHRDPPVVRAVIDHEQLSGQDTKVDRHLSRDVESALPNVICTREIFPRIFIGRGLSHKFSSQNFSLWRDNMEISRMRDRVARKAKQYA